MSDRIWLVLKTVVDDCQSKPGRFFALFIQELIVVSLISFSIGTLPGLSNETLSLLRYIEWFTVIVFTIEYLLRLAVSEKKLGFIFSFFGLIDLAAILPFYIGTGFDLRSIRAFRLLRLILLLKLIRYSKAATHYQRAFVLAKEELVLFLLVSIILLYLAAVGIYFFENEEQPEQFSSVFHSLWWAVATLTTVGYGDIYPITVGGKIFTYFVLMIGLGVVVVPAGLIASALSQTTNEDQ